MFDLESLNIQETSTLEILHPEGTPRAGEGTGWVLTLATLAHAGVQAKVSAILDRSKKRKAPTPTQDEADMLALVCAHVLGWEGLVMNGEEVPYSPEAAAKVLGGARSFWIREQLMKAIGDPARPFLS